MEYTGQKLQWGLPMEDVKAGDYLLFINQPKSYDPKKPNYRTVECADESSKGLEIGMILSAYYDGGGMWVLRTDLQSDPLRHRQDLLINKVEITDSGTAFKQSDEFI